MAGSHFKAGQGLSVGSLNIQAVGYMKEHNSKFHMDNSKNEMMEMFEKYMDFMYKEYGDTDLITPE